MEIGIFVTEDITIENENQEFVLKIQETQIPKGYNGLNEPFYLRVKTGLNYEKTAYIVYQATLEDEEGNEFTGAEVICEKETDEIVITVPNEKIKIFDLALRKFITAVNDDEVTTRIPTVSVNENEKIVYEHSKTPVSVANTDIVTYTLRIYNEGNVAGYAMEISDDIPDGLEFLPNNQTNIDYKWKMYDANGNETTQISEAVEIRTKYLENRLLNPFDVTKTITNTEPLNPDYADVKVAFKVVEGNITQEDRIIINKAQITKDKAVDTDGNELQIDDIDSEPGKWNEGEIAGYATEITDYIPEGLEFIVADNPNWTLVEIGKITTDQLKNTLLQPGETATIEVVFTWKNGEDNLGLKTNIAEISEDYNEKEAKDIDSTPDNVITENYDEQQEDDDDKALVILELRTGGAASYIILILIVLVIVAGGIILIQKFVV